MTRARLVQQQASARIARLTITVSPVGVPGMFDAHVGDDHICTSRQPFVDSARILADQGVDPGATITMQHANTDHWSLRSTVAAAARLTVEDRDRGSVRFARWRPMPLLNVAPCVAPTARGAAQARVEAQDSPSTAPRSRR